MRVGFCHMPVAKRSWSFSDASSTSNRPHCILSGTVLTDSHLFPTANMFVTCLQGIPPNKRFEGFELHLSHTGSYNNASWQLATNNFPNGCHGSCAKAASKKKTNTFLSTFNSNSAATRSSCLFTDISGVLANCDPQRTNGCKFTSETPQKCAQFDCKTTANICQVYSLNTPCSCIPQGHAKPNDLQLKE